MSADPSLGALDPRCSRVLRAELPGVRDAFDEGLMRRHLQASLFEDGGHRYIIGRCERGKAVYVPGEGCAVRYAIEVRHHVGRLVTPALVTARLFQSARAARAYFESCLGPLAAAVRGRSDLPPFVTPVAVLEPLSMAVSLFPVDGELPTLVGATDPATMLEILREAPPAVNGKPLIPMRCGVDVAHYPRQHHCVLRYTLEGTRSAGDEASRATVFGKVAGDDRGALAAAAMLELRERILRGETRPFAVPRSLGFVEPLRLVLLEAIPGVPRISQLLREHLQNAPEAHGTPTLEDSTDWAARVAAGLHTSGIRVGPARRAEVELTELKEALAVLERVSPDLAARFQEWLDSIAACAAASDPWPACFSHGDFSASQLVFSGDQCGLIDFDTVCQAEPALDLGQFLAYLRLAARKAGGSASGDGKETTERVCARFLEEYMNACGYAARERDRLQARVRLYEMVSLLRLVFHSWRKFKGARLALAAGLLRERLPSLTGETA